MTRALVSATTLLVGLALAGEAHASKDYPAVVQSQYRMGRKPLPVPGAKGCVLCHTNDAGGKGTTTQPFGITVHQRYRVGGLNSTALRRALDLVRTDQTNSDRDRVTDYVEIAIDGTNPNDARSFVEPPPVVEPSEGGQGGEAGTGGASGAGGDGASVIDGAVPPPLPPLDELPPPFTHGCALSTHSAPAAPVLVGLLFAARAVSRRRRRR